jgi:NADPH:quinone reductase-like Zn-dependent oxidoreductase
MRLTGDQGVDLVFEHVGGELFQKGLDSLGKDGRLVICGGHSGEVVPFDIIPFFRMQRQIIGSFVTRAARSRPASSLPQGKIMPLVYKVFPLGRGARRDGVHGAPRALRQIVLKPGAST